MRLEEKDLELRFSGLRARESMLGAKEMRARPLLADPAVLAAGAKVRAAGGRVSYSPGHFYFS